MCLSERYLMGIWAVEMNTEDQIPQHLSKRPCSLGCRAELDEGGEGELKATECSVGKVQS